MELLFVVLGGAIIGLAARYSFPQPETYGALLMPAIGAVSASVVWAALTWAGWKFDGGWIWVVSLAAAGITAVLVSLFLARSRVQSDHSLLAKLSRA